MPHAPPPEPHPTQPNLTDARRGELGPNEDPNGLTPKALLSRPPSLAILALIAILDPPRDEAIEAVKVAHTAGITVKMITGSKPRGGGVFCGRVDSPFRGAERPPPNPPRNPPQNPPPTPLDHPKTVQNTPSKLALNLP
jgi:hypothetical protein